MGSDDLDVDKIPKDAFVVYQGDHGDKAVYRANVILPAMAFTEKEGTYERYTQQTVPTVPTVGEAIDDWKIVRGLSEVSGVKLPNNSIEGVRSRIKTVAPNLVHTDEGEPVAFGPSLKHESKETIDTTPFKPVVENFYMTNSFTRASKIKAQCSVLLLKK